MWLLFHLTPASRVVIQNDMANAVLSCLVLRQRLGGWWGRRANDVLQNLKVLAAAPQHRQLRQCPCVCAVYPCRAALAQLSSGQFCPAPVRRASQRSAACIAESFKPCLRSFVVGTAELGKLPSATKKLGKLTNLPRTRFLPRLRATIERSSQVTWQRLLYFKGSVARRKTQP